MIGTNERDSGAATVLAAGAMAAIMGIAWLVVSVGLAVVTRHRAGSAADLSVLAATAYASTGSMSACERARWVTDRMKVDLSRCDIRDEEALVEVTAKPPGLLGEFGTVSVLARAGPSEPRGVASITTDGP